jgi:hypothetical protein
VRKREGGGRRPEDEVCVGHVESRDNDDKWKGRDHFEEAKDGVDLGDGQMVERKGRVGQGRGTFTRKRLLSLQQY